MDTVIKILIVEDDASIAAVLSRHLEQWGYQVYCIKDFKKVFEEFEALQPQLVIMDIGLPAFNGCHWCAKIREVSQVPIVFLSSRNETANIVFAMQIGGDEYIEKPFDIEAAIAKIQAVLRRAYHFTASINELRFGNTVLNLGTLTLSYHNKTVLLTANELKILKPLYLAQGNFVEREKIMDILWQNNQFVSDNTLSVNITRLRKKLEDIGLTGFIINKKGFGYKLNETLSGSTVVQSQATLDGAAL